MLFGTQGLARGGWARRPLPISPEMLVLDIGSGSFPNPRADILCDRYLSESAHRSGAEVVVDRPMVIADISSLPFRSNSVDFVIASHVAEHVADPDSMCRELSRVFAAGYIETPSPIADYLLDEKYHIWRVGYRDGTIRFRSKPQKPYLASVCCDVFYKVYYSGDASRESVAFRLPSGLPGRIIRVILRIMGGSLNRLHIFTTSVIFDVTRPLNWSVERPGSGSD